MIIKLEFIVKKKARINSDFNKNRNRYEPESVIYQPPLNYKSILNSKSRIIKTSCLRVY